MPVSAARLAANRSNAQKSTGPRTQAGKDRAKLNGRTHGLFCTNIVMPGESKKQFLALRNLFLLDLKPSDSAECMLVDRIVIANWKLKRLHRIEAMVNRGYAQQMADEDNRKLQQLDPGTALEVRARDIRSEASQALMFLSDDSAFDRIERHTNRLELSIQRALRELAKLKKRTQAEREELDPQNMYLPTVPTPEDIAAIQKEEAGEATESGSEANDVAETQDQRTEVRSAEEEMRNDEERTLRPGSQFDALFDENAFGRSLKVARGEDASSFPGNRAQPGAIE